MALDIRATTTCNLGPLISANISDDYIQLSGLVKTQGNCVIKGIINPNLGDIVTFQYTRNGSTKSIPKKLRVLSFFCDPYEGITSVTLGCKLTYLSDLRERIVWRQINDPENASEAEDDIVVFPIRAKSVANYCLQQLGITANRMPLTNQFSVQSFDFSSGYVQVLSDLLLSEGYFGYLNQNEKLVVKSLEEPLPSAPVVSQDEIIAIGEVNAGQLPGEAVTVSYNTVKLNKPKTEDDDDEEANLVDWDYSLDISRPRDYFLTAKNRNGEEFELSWTYAPWSVETAEYDGWDRLVKRTKISYDIVVDFASGYLSDAISACFSGISPSIAQSLGSREYSTEEITEITYKIPVNKSLYEKPDGYDEVVAETTEIYEPEGKIHAGLQYNFTSDLGGLFVTPFSSFVGNPRQLTRRRTVTYYKANVGNQVYPGRLPTGSSLTPRVYPSYRTFTTEYAAFGYTSRGQAFIAKATENGNRFLSLSSQATRLVNDGSSTQITTGRQIGLQERPSKEARIIDKATDRGVDPNNGFSTASQSKLRLVFGSAAAQRRIEFSLPYAPDDTFFRTQTGIDPETGDPLYEYGSIKSDAGARARYFGRIQSRLLLGSRNGMNIQTTPENIPIRPFSRFAITASGITGLYCTNAISWTMDSTGIIVSTDAMFWQPIGGSGTPWFPVSPSVGALPAAPVPFVRNPTVLGSISNVYQ